MNEKVENLVVEQIDTTDWKDMYLRLSADMDNLRKRIFKEKEELFFLSRAPP